MPWSEAFLRLLGAALAIKRGKADPKDNPKAAKLARDNSEEALKRMISEGAK